MLRQQGSMRTSAPVRFPWRILPSRLTSGRRRALSIGPDSLAPKQARDVLSGTRVEGCVIALLDLVFRVGAVRHDAADVTESGACPG